MDALRTTADDRPPPCMRAMIRRLGVDILELMYERRGGVYEECCIVCRKCENAAACMEWLEAAPDAKEAPDFCPNAETFERFKAP